jgi:hypothetical protein
MERGKSKLIGACAVVPVILLIGISTMSGQWSQPPVEVAPMGPEPNFYGLHMGGSRDANFPAVWFNGWNNPYQCHGDADGKNTGAPYFYRVYNADLFYLVDSWYKTYLTFGDANYEPNADFSRDGHVNYLDLVELARWWKRVTPSDCPGSVPWATLVADDFKAVNKMPIVSIRWWGGYFRWDGNDPPATVPASWQICFWSDIPDPNPYDGLSVLTHSQPGTLLKKVNIPAGRVSSTKAGTLAIPWAGLGDTVFEYYVDLNETEYFRAEDFNSLNDVYWVSIMGIYSSDVNTLYPWGWLSRVWYLMDGGVKMTLMSEPNEGMVATDSQTEVLRNYCTWATGDFGTPGYWDFAFELGTEPNYFKWEQRYGGMREWSFYEDLVCSATEDANGQVDPYTMVLADDWECVGANPVTGVIWWGSYIGYEYHPSVQHDPYEYYDKPNYFLLSVWTDVPAQDPCVFSHPGRKIWEFKATSFDEVMVGFDSVVDVNGDPREAVFRYLVLLPEDEWFYQRDTNGIYWLRILAVFEGEHRYEWGWTNHQHIFGDYAVRGEYAVASPQWTKLNNDMSFVLLTSPNYCSGLPDYDFDCIVDLADLDVFVDDWLRNCGSGRYCGADLDCDCHVNLIDLALFGQQWMSITPVAEQCPDYDGDGYGNPGSHCCPHSQTDCNDENPGVHPYATEICNDGMDNDCDGLIDCADSGCACADVDGDGYGITASPCCQYAGIDCNDNNPNIHPGAAEICDGKDNDCDSIIDNVDMDKDGYTDQNCGGNDCNDNDPNVNPGATEVCTNGKDDDCDGAADCADSQCACADADGDGYGDPPGPCCAHSQQDCNDHDQNVNPGHSEVCTDGKDNDCEGLIDCADSDCSCTDVDGDGYGATASPCCQYAGIDCNDNDPNIHPGAAEICDGKDNDCDSITDNVDMDDDGYIDQNCGGNDCNDNDPNIHPGAAELCTNGKDDDCNGVADCADGQCACADSDGDGYGINVSPCCSHAGIDCNDNDPNIHPGAQELCSDGKDNDCDTQVDCDDSNCYGDPCCPSNWPECWDCLYQCHGDAGCDIVMSYRVSTSDLVIFQAAFPSVYGGPGNYDPCADFDRDGDVDTADLLIIQKWLNKVPGPDPNCVPGGTWPP